MPEDITNAGTKSIKRAIFASIDLYALTFGIESLGVFPTTIDPGEMHLALQSGTIDAAIAGVTTIDQRKLREATSHATVAGVVYGIFSANMNLDKFNSLPEDVQAVLKDAAWEVATWSFERAVKVLDEEEKQRRSEIVSDACESWKSRADEDEISLVE